MAVPREEPGRCALLVLSADMLLHHGSEAWLSHQGENDRNAVKQSHLSLRLRSSHAGGTGMGSLYLGEVVEINYEYY